MRAWIYRAGVWVGILAMMAGCATPQGRPGGPGEPIDAQRVATPKRVTAAIRGELATLNTKITAATGRSVPGGDVIEELVSAGLANIDGGGRLRPQLAEAVPTQENGLWKLSPDGRMETRWRIRRGARWHDGTPVTSDDLLFTTLVEQDKEVLALGHIAYASIDAIEALDSFTVVVSWRQPFIHADRMFSHEFGLPWPKHLLGHAYRGDRADFTQHPYWRSEFVGSGPFKLKDWVPGSHVSLVAFDQYVLGRPKIDEIEVRFIPDSNALAANILAGTVELTLGRGIDLDQGIRIRDQWKDGRMDVGLANWIVTNPQLLTPDPLIIGDVRFRRALLHAMDRQEMADSLMGGLVPVGHSWVAPDEPEYKDIESAIVRYEYDPRRATQLMEALGYPKGSDGMFRTPSGEKLVVEIRTTGGNEIHQKALLAVADYWQRLGIGVNPVLIPQQRSRDAQYRATFPGFELQQNPNDADSLNRLHSSQTPLPENNFTGSNKNRYMNPQFDQLIERYFATVPRQERLETLRQLIHHMTDQALQLGIFLNAETAFIANRLQHVTVRTLPKSNSGWNAEQWDVR